MTIKATESGTGWSKRINFTLDGISYSVPSVRNSAGAAAVESVTIEDRGPVYYQVCSVNYSDGPGCWCGQTFRRDDFVATEA
jgi:hypothetical protein